VGDVVAQLHVLDDLRQCEHPRADRPGDLVLAAEQDHSAARGKSTLQLDGPPDVAGVLVTARFLDVGSDRVEFAGQFLDVLGGEVGVFLDVGDGHVVLLRC
jgi:hypothetical protein